MCVCAAQESVLVGMLNEVLCSIICGGGGRVGGNWSIHNLNQSLKYAYNNILTYT